MNGAESDIDSWQEARLIPTSGINGGEEQERRATSALLAVMASVKEFGRALTQPLGAPAGTVQTFIEVPFPHGDRKVYPDGLIRVRRGQREWTALVEVKTGTTPLDPAQLETYLDVARGRGFDALLTISNQIAPTAGQHPTPLDRRRTRSVALHHYSWSQVLTEAVVQREHRGVADPDQAWILGELIRYLEHDRSGALEFDDMGRDWVAVREAVLDGTLRPTDPGTTEVANRFDALLRFAGLKLGRRLGTDVVPLRTRKEQADPALRAAGLVSTLASSGTLTGVLRIPQAVGALTVTTDLRAGRVICHIDVEAPRVGRPVTRVNWLVRQLGSAPDTLRVEVFTAHTRASVSAELLGRVRAEPDRLVLDPSREIRGFRLALELPLGPKRGRGKGGFADSVLFAIETFYADVIQSLRSWTAKAAKPPLLRQDSHDEPVAERLVASSLSSQDGPEPAPARIPAPARPIDQLNREAVTWTVTLPGPRGPSRREIRRLVTGIEGQDEEGWYADPDRQGQLRWWNGTGWSEYVYEVQAVGGPGLL
ncbi:DUF2510 domain-containing protein [Kineosporia sp. J2-2]|uniref:DUF2510 domain-containing protein n=1 Tax=Kineosporia corallincola TaxID=2835133 RepID=A0ABS5TSL6_9ACTN|nr:DUF2510 domain-containing protein [Kineosporia corallincola]MBT0773806.1 DUF2510 domain-containing protein [Kineosporia corallincola]